LDGEVTAGLRAREQLEPGVEKTLDPTLAADTRRVEGAGDRQVPPPDRGIRAGLGVGVVSGGPRPECIWFPLIESGTLPNETSDAKYFCKEVSPRRRM
jgi:hypothetical protein